MKKKSTNGSVNRCKEGNIRLIKISNWIKISKWIKSSKLINLFWNKFQTFRELFRKSLEIILRINGLNRKLIRITFMLNI